MRMKYFVRGIGIGFIISSLIFIICFTFYQPTLSEEQIRREALKLGMIDGDAYFLEEEETPQVEEQVQEDTDTSVDESEDSEETEEPEEPEESEETVSTEYEQPDTVTVTVTEVPVEEVDDAPRSNTTEYVTFTVSSGETSYRVGENLYKKGLVDDASDFDTYLENQNLDNMLLPGTYSIPKGATYKEISEILTSK